MTDVEICLKGCTRTTGPSWPAIIWCKWVQTITRGPWRKSCRP